MFLLLTIGAHGECRWAVYFRDGDQYPVADGEYAPGDTTLWAVNQNYDIEKTEILN